LWRTETMSMTGTTPISVLISLRGSRRRRQCWWRHAVGPHQRRFFSDKKSMSVKSAGKTVYEANEIHKAIFIKNLLDYSDDYARSVAKSQFWYLDSDATNVIAAAARNSGTRQRGLKLSFPSTVIRFSKNYLISFFHQCNLILRLCCKMTTKLFFRTTPPAVELLSQSSVWIVGSTAKADIWRTKAGQWKFLETDSMELLKRNDTPQLQRRDASGFWLITPGIKNPNMSLSFSSKLEKKFSGTKSLHLRHLPSRWGRLGKTVHLPPAVWDQLLSRAALWKRLQIANPRRSDKLQIQKKMTTTRAFSCKSATSQQFTLSFTLTSDQPKKV